MRRNSRGVDPHHRPRGRWRGLRSRPGRRTHEGSERAGAHPQRGRQRVHGLRSAAPGRHLRASWRRRRPPCRRCLRAKDRVQRQVRHPPRAG